MTIAALTGVGVVSAFGVGAPTFFRSLAEGRAAVKPIRAFDASAFPVRVAGEVSEVPALEGIRDRKLALGLVAAREAWLAAGCGSAERTAALVVAVGLEAALLEDFGPFIETATANGHIDWKAARRASLPQVAFRAPIDAVLSTLGDRLGLVGPRVGHVSACAAGALAVAHAAALVERGECDVVLAGGTDSMINPLGLAGMARLQAPSPRHAADACRPFDRRRDGLVMGEGAAMFVVENEARARARGARVLARVLGWGSTQDGYRATAPRPDGRVAARAISKALARAALAPEAVGYVNAHGTGTPLNDPAEARALHLALGPHGARVPVSSIKGAIGHLMAASGAVELAACLLPFAQGILPGTAHHREPDPACDINVIGETPQAAEIEVALSSSFGFGGQNAAVLLGRGDR